MQKGSISYTIKALTELESEELALLYEETEKFLGDNDPKLESDGF
jgi:hypothetical protein